MYKSDLGASLTNEQFENYVDLFGGYLQYKGVEKGDRVAIMMPNILQYPIVAQAVMDIGAVVVNVNPLYTADELEHVLEDSGAKVIVAYTGATEVIEQAVGEQEVIMTSVGDMLPTVKGKIVDLVMKYKKGARWPNRSHVKFTKALSQSRRIAPVVWKWNDLALLQYTGATTGKSKGVEITRRMLKSNVDQISDRMNGFIGYGDTVVAPLPLYHIYAFMVSIMWLPAQGAESLLVANPRDIPAFVKTLRKNKFQGFLGLNTLFNALMNHKNFNKIDFIELRTTISGGMALTTDIAERWKDSTGSHICEGYGLTETSPVLCLNDPYEPRVGSVGKPVEGVKVKLGKDDELLVKGPNVFKRYWKNKQATKDSFTWNGWFKTGDVASIDEDGYVYITDRIKNMIIVSGFNVYPNEVENVLNSCPGVVESAVIGVPHKGTERVVAYVVGKDVDQEQIIGYAKSKLTKYKVPTEVRFIDELPKTPVGKVLHRKLKEV